MALFTELMKLSLVGLISGLFTAYIATRAYRNKKWWEMRVAAYQSLIEALSDIEHYYNIEFDNSCDNRPPNEAHEAKLNKLIDDALPKVRKAAACGVFLFSEEVNQALEKFFEPDTPSICTQVFLDNNRNSAKNCLNTIVLSANKDLRLKNTWLL